MIIPNGNVQFIEGSGGLDDNGYPVASAAVYGEPIPCQYQASSHNYLGKSNGEAIIRSGYSILIEKCCGRMKRTERLKLLDKCKNTIDEFSVISFEPLDAVCQIRITV